MTCDGDWDEATILRHEAAVSAMRAGGNGNGGGVGGVCAFVAPDDGCMEADEYEEEEGGEYARGECMDEDDTDSGMEEGDAVAVV